MTVEIKRMLAERATLRAKQEPVREELPNDVKELLAMVDTAAPYIDEGSDPSKWKPSELLKLTYFILATGPSENGSSDGLRFVWRMLDKARRRFVSGRHPNPFADDQHSNMVAS